MAQPVRQPEIQMNTRRKVIDVDQPSGMRAQRIRESFSYSSIFMDVSDMTSRALTA